MASRPAFQQLAEVEGTFAFQRRVGFEDHPLDLRDQRGHALDRAEILDELL